jgi:hypothetical protein
MKIKTLTLSLGAAMLCVFTTPAHSQQKPLAQGVATLVSGDYKGANGTHMETFWAHATVSTPAASSVANVGYLLSNCGTAHSENVGALFVGKIVPGRSFEILSHDPGDTSTACWMIYKRR